MEVKYLAGLGVKDGKIKQKVQDMPDKINPAYYQAGKCECGRTLQTYDYVKDLPYADATAIKYITRHRLKGGATDIRKAIWFLKAILKDEYKNDSNVE